MVELINGIYDNKHLLRESKERDDDFITITRSTFEETIPFIPDDFDVAAELLLGYDEMKISRATKGAALALRSRLLLFAASDLTADDNREPRFLTSILYDGAIWQPRFPNLAGRDPVGIYERRTLIITENGETTTIYGIDTRQGPVEN